MMVLNELDLMLRLQQIIGVKRKRDHSSLTITFMDTPLINVTSFMATLLDISQRKSHKMWLLIKSLVRLLLMKR